MSTAMIGHLIPNKHEHITLFWPCATRASYGALISLVTSEFLHVHAQIYKKLQVAHLVLASQSRRSFSSERRTGKCARKRERGGRQKGGMGKNDSVPKCPVLLLSNNSNACLVLVRSVFILWLCCFYVHHLSQINLYSISHNIYFFKAVLQKIIMLMSHAIIYIYIN